MLQDLEDKTPLLLEQKQAYDTLKRNYHTLLLQWNQFCEQTLTSSEGSFTDSTKLLYAEVLRLREEVASSQRQVELLRSQRDALRSKLLLRGDVRVGGVECSEKKECEKVSDVKVSDVKEVCKEKEKEKVEKVCEEKVEKEKEKEKKKVEKKKVEKEEMEKACELSQLRESAKRLERRLQEAEGRRKRAEAKSQSLQSQLARCERALAEIGLNSDTTRLSRMSALAMVSVWRRSDGKELRSHFDDTATVLLRSLVEGNARIQGYLERGLESVAQLQTKLTVPETPTPLLEVNEEGEEKPLSEAISAGQHQEYLDFADELIEKTGNAPAALAAMLQLRFKGELLPQSYVEIGRKRDRKTWESSADDHGSTRLFIGVGKLDGFGAVKMLDLIWEKARIKKYRIGKIDCYDRFSFVNVNFEDAEAIIDAFRRGGPKVQLAAERPSDEQNAGPAERPNRSVPVRRSREEHAERPERRTYTRRSAETASAERPMRRSKPETPATAKKPVSDKKRRLTDWVEKISSDIELKEKKAKRSKKSEK